MVQTIEALFDGTVFHPTERIALAPNTRVRMTIETVLPAEGETASFLRTARALNLAGPPDWAANIDEYLFRLSYLGFRHNPFYIRAFVDSFACAMPVKSMTRAMKGPTPYKELL